MGKSTTNAGRSFGSWGSPNTSNAAAIASPGELLRGLLELPGVLRLVVARGGAPERLGEAAARERVRGGEPERARADLDERDARVRRGEIDALSLERDDRAARHLHRERVEQLLGEAHQVLVRGVRLVELDRRELRVVAPVDPLVPADPPDLVDAIEPAHHEALQVQLRRDAELQVEVERVVVRLEGPGRGAARLLRLVQGRRLDLEVAARVEEAADRGHDARRASGTSRARRA